MYWQKWSENLKRELRLESEPVAVTFAGAVPGGAAAPAGKVSRLSGAEADQRGRGRDHHGGDVRLPRRPCEPRPGTDAPPRQGAPGGLPRQPGEGLLLARRAASRPAGRPRPGRHGDPRLLRAPLRGGGAAGSGDPHREARLPALPHRLRRLLGGGGSLPTELAGPACRTGIAYPVVTGNLGRSRSWTSERAAWRVLRRTSSSSPCPSTGCSGSCTHSNRGSPAPRRAARGHRAPDRRPEVPWSASEANGVTGGGGHARHEEQ